MREREREREAADKDQKDKERPSGKGGAKDSEKEQEAIKVSSQQRLTFVFNTFPDSSSCIDLCTGTVSGHHKEEETSETPE